MLAGICFACICSFIPLKAEKIASAQGIARELKLNTDQRNEIKRIGKEVRRMMDDQQDIIARNQEKVREMIENGNYTPAKAEELLRQNADARMQVEKAMISAYNKLQETLTADQQKKLSEIRHKRLEKEVQSENNDFAGSISISNGNSFTTINAGGNLNGMPNTSASAILPPEDKALLELDMSNINIMKTSTLPGLRPLSPGMLKNQLRLHLPNKDFLKNFNGGMEFFGGCDSDDADEQEEEEIIEKEISPLAPGAPRPAAPPVNERKLEKKMQELEKQIEELRKNLKKSDNR
jgi:Spy/CpxP family protein refolding chaperone